MCVSELFTYDFDPIAQSAKAQSAMNAENWQQLSQAKRPLVKVYLEAKPWNGLTYLAVVWNLENIFNKKFCSTCLQNGLRKSGKYLVLYRITALLLLSNHILL